jgi:chromosome segregation ATPase
VLERRVADLTAANKSLQETAATKRIQEKETKKQQRALAAVNADMHEEIASLEVKLKDVELKCITLDEDACRMKEKADVAKETQRELVKVESTLVAYKHKLELLRPLVVINQDLESSLSDTRSQLEELELAVSTRIRLEEQNRETDLEELQTKQLQKVVSSLQAELTLSTDSYSRLEEELSDANSQLREEKKARQTLATDCDRLQDDLSLQCVRSMKLEQTIETHQSIFRQYKVLIKDTYHIISELEEDKSPLLTLESVLTENVVS